MKITTSRALSAGLLLLAAVAHARAAEPRAVDAKAVDAEAVETETVDAKTADAESDEARATKAATYRFDPVHSQVLFFASHLGFSRSMGRFPGLSGTFTYDPDDTSVTRVDAEIALDSLYLGDEAWEKKMLSRDFLAAKTHPVARFVATRYERTGDKRGKLAGELTLRGVTRPVVLDVVENRVGRHSFSLQYVAGFSATTTIRRSDFGMRRLLPAVADEVEIRLEIEGIRESASRTTPHQSD